MTDIATPAETPPDEHRFRNYRDAPQHVQDFYRENHEKQTLAFVLEMKEKYTTPENRRTQMTMWEMMDALNSFVDDSDPDTSFTQMEHAMQTAERIRKDGHPDWMVATGFIHDAGKALASLHNLPQWAVVGDTFPVGCAFSDAIIFPELFENNPDRTNPVYSTRLGIYEEGCGLHNINLSFGHDEYLYHVIKDDSRLPEPALAMIRFHSFYAWHREGAYTQFMDEHDREMLPWVKRFNPYDLYSKGDARPNVPELEPFYRGLVQQYFPDQLSW
jgi:inositol oxygenase